MPAEQRGHVRKLPSGWWQLRFRERKGVYRSGGAFASKADALNHYRDEVAPRLSGRHLARRDLTFSELVDVFLQRHAMVAKPRTITELRWRLKQSQGVFGDVPLAELEGMADEIAGFLLSLGERLRYPIMAAFRQALEAGVCLRLPDPEPGEAGRAEPDAQATGDPGLHRRGAAGDRRGAGQVEAAAVRFPAATGLMPAEWASIERRDVDKARRVMHVRGTKTVRSRREVPLTVSALDALEQVPPRIDSRYVFTTTRRCPGQDEPGPFAVANFRRTWGPAIDAAGVNEACEAVRPTVDVRV